MSCTKSSKTKQNSNLITIDMHKAKSIDINNIIKCIKCIKLENLPNATFRDCWKIRMYDKFIYIYSLSDFAVFIFSNQGKYITTLDSKCDGEITFPVDIFINKQENELWLINEKTTIKKYTLSGDKYLGDIELPYKTTAMSRYSKNEFLLYDGNCNKDISGYIGISTLLRDKEINFFATKNTPELYDGYILPSLFAPNNKGNIYTILPNNDTIFISKNKSNDYFSPLFYLDFHGDFLNDANWPKNGFSDKTYAEMMMSKKYIYNISSFYFAANKLFFKTQGKYSDYFMIDTKLNTIHKFDRLIDDLQTRTPATSIQGSSNNELYFIFDANHLISHYKNKKLKSKYSNINNLLGNLNKNDNKVIFICTLKQ